MMDDPDHGTGHLAVLLWAQWAGDDPNACAWWPADLLADLRAWDLIEQNSCYPTKRGRVLARAIGDLPFPQWRMP